MRSLLVALFLTTPTIAIGSTIPVGAAKVDITPDFPVMLSGYSSRVAESSKAAGKLWVKALAIGSDESGPVIVITADNLGIPDAIGTEVAKRLKAKLGIAREKIAFSASHTHCAPFINGCMAHLIQRSSGPYNRVAGEPLKWVPGDLQKDYFVIAPDGEKMSLGKPRDFEGQIRLPVFDTKKAGLYQIVAVGDTQGERFAFTPDLRETENLETLPDAQIDDQLGFKPIHLSTNFDGSTFNGTERSRKEWTIWVLVLLLIFAIGEAIWAWRCGKAW